jgi:ribosome-associated translation inhibitor RaiA
MQIQINTGSHIEGSQRLESFVKSEVEGGLKRFSDQITRVEVHFSDVNGQKGGHDDKRCVMEARLKGVKPIAATHQAATLDLALSGCMEKIKKSLDSTLGRLHSR